jgi:hypothetical protein
LAQLLPAPEEFPSGPGHLLGEITRIFFLSSHEGCKKTTLGPRWQLRNRSNFLKWREGWIAAANQGTSRHRITSVSCMTKAKAQLRASKKQPNGFERWLTEAMLARSVNLGSCMRMAETPLRVTRSSQVEPEGSETRKFCCTGQPWGRLYARPSRAKRLLVALARP